ncbi:mechanosensitive ion channel family protein [Cytobacillus gottheilii]|nr:mechanosensitive ion channel family protein [Cytobacillus gottheilii]
MDFLNDISLQINQINWEQILLSLLTILLKVAAVFIVFAIVKAAGNKLIAKMFSKIQLKQSISVGRAKTLESLTQNILNYILLFVFIVTVLQLFGIEATAILAGAGVLGLAIGFGAQGLVSDVVTGFFILIEKQIDVGDYVTIGTFSGIVEQVGLRNTQVRGFDGALYYIPNRTITTVSNHSRGTMNALVDMIVTYENYLEETMAAIQKAAKEYAKDNELILEGPNVIAVQAPGSSKLVLRVIAKTVNTEKGTVEKELQTIFSNTLEEMKNHPAPKPGQ